MNLRRASRFVEDGLATVMDLFARPPTETQAALARRLVTDLDALLRIGSAGEGSDFWRGICEALYRLAATEDPMYFMRWPAIEATMVHRAAPAAFRMWWALRRSSAWRSVWAPALRHPQYGHPPPFLLMPTTNVMAVEHAAHLLRYRQRHGIDFYDADCIVEFGGGFGSMCRMVRALGFRGRYIIFDLPPVSALQRYYLGLHGIEAGDADGLDVWLCPDLDTITRSLARRPPARLSLTSTWAMSEMPMPVRAKIEPFLECDAAAKVLLAYQPAFEGIDNRAYFRDLMARTADRWAWSETVVDRPPDGPPPDGPPTGAPPGPADSLYMTGTRR